MQEPQSLGKGVGHAAYGFYFKREDTFTLQCGQRLEKGSLFQLLRRGSLQGLSMKLQKNVKCLEGSWYPGAKHCLTFLQETPLKATGSHFQMARLFLLILSAVGIRHEEPCAVTCPETRNWFDESVTYRACFHVPQRGNTSPELITKLNFKAMSGEREA